MRASVILGLLLLSTTLSLTGLAADPAVPPPVSEAVTSSYGEAITTAARSLDSAREAAGPQDERVERAGRLLDRAQDSLAVRNPNQALTYAASAQTLAIWAEAEHETQGADDQQGALVERARTERAITQNQQAVAYRSLAVAQAAGLSPTQVDRALVASQLLAEGQRLASSWDAGLAAWQQGSRATPGPFTAAVAPRATIVAAQALLAGITDLDPAGRPIAGNETMQTAVDAFRGLLEQRGVAFDATENPRLRSAVASRAWLAAMGTSILWSGHQPSAHASVLASRGELPAPASLLDELEAAIQADRSLQQAERTGAPGLQAASSIQVAVGALQEGRTALSDNRTSQARNEALHGFAALSQARTGTAFLRALAGHGSTDGLVVLATGPVGTMDVPGREPGDEGGVFLGLGPVASAVALALLCLAIVGVIGLVKRSRGT